MDSGGVVAEGALMDLGLTVKKGVHGKVLQGELAQKHRLRAQGSPDLQGPRR